MESKKITFKEIDEMLKPFKGFTKDIFIVADSELKQAVRELLDELSEKYLKDNSDIHSIRHNSDTNTLYDELNVVGFHRSGLNVFLGDWSTLYKLQHTTKTITNE